MEHYFCPNTPDLRIVVLDTAFKLAGNSAKIVLYF